jgi:hypothetical protein
MDLRPHLWPLFRRRLVQLEAGLTRPLPFLWATFPWRPMFLRLLVQLAVGQILGLLPKKPSFARSRGA